MLPTISHWHEGGYFCDKTLTATLLNLSQRKKYVSVTVDVKVPKLIQEHIFNTIENLLDESDNQHLKEKGIIEIRIAASKKAAYLKISLAHINIINKIVLLGSTNEKLQIEYSEDELILITRDEASKGNNIDKKQYCFMVAIGDAIPIYIDLKLKEKTSRAFQRLLLTMAKECLNHNRRYFMYYFGKPAFEMEYNYNQLYYHRESLDKLKQIYIKNRGESIMIQRDWVEIYEGTDRFYLKESNIFQQGISIYLFENKVLISEYYDEALISKKAELSHALKEEKNLPKKVSGRRKIMLNEEKMRWITLDEL